MKALVVAAVLVASASIAPVGAVRDAHPIDTVDKATAAVIADAGHLGSAGLTALNAGNAPWAPAGGQAATEFDVMVPPVDTGLLLVAVGVAALGLARPVSRALRRQEQHRRAAALASTLGHTPRD